MLQTSNLIIRPFTLADTRMVFVLSQEKSLRKYIPDQVYDSEQEASKVLQYLISQYKEVPSPRTNPYVLGVAIQETNKLIGHVGLSPTDSGGIEIGYAIAEAEQGKGYATEIVGRMTQWALQLDELPFIIGIVDSENVASCKVLEKSGFQLIEEKAGNAFGKYGLCRIYRIVKLEPLCKQ